MAQEAGFRMNKLMEKLKGKERYLGTGMNDDDVIFKKKDVEQAYQEIEADLRIQGMQRYEETILQQKLREQSEHIKQYLIKRIEEAKKTGREFYTEKEDCDLFNQGLEKAKMIVEGEEEI